MKELAQEIVLRLRRHGITGRERLVLVDRGDGIGAMPAAQLAELAGHKNVSILLGGMAGWEGELETGTFELEPVREADLVPDHGALPTRDELAGRLDDHDADDPRRPPRRGVHGQAWQRVRPAPGAHPGRAARRGRLALRGAGRAAAGRADPRARRRAGRRRGGRVLPLRSRSAIATLALRSAGYAARNYAGSWHEWSRHAELPLERYETRRPRSSLLHDEAVERSARSSFSLRRSGTPATNDLLLLAGAVTYRPALVGTRVAWFAGRYVRRSSTRK